MTNNKQFTFKDIYPTFTVFKQKINGYGIENVFIEDTWFYNTLFGYWQNRYFLLQEQNAIEAEVQGIWNTFKIKYVKVLKQQKKEILDLGISSQLSESHTGDESNINSNINKFFDGGGANKFTPSILTAIGGFIGLPDIYIVLKNLFSPIFESVKETTTFQGLNMIEYQQQIRDALGLSGTALKEEVVKDNSITEQKLTQKIRDVHNKHNDYENLHTSHIQRIDSNKNKIETEKQKNIEQDEKIGTLENKYDNQGKLKLQYYQAGSGSPTIADGSITNSKIADGAITNSKVGVGAITNSKIGTDAITRSKIDNGAVGKEQIGDQQISKSKLKMALQDKIDMIDANDANNKTIQSYFDVNSKLRYSHLPKDYGYAERNRLTFGERSTGGIGIGKYSSGNLFIGENKTGGIFLAHNSTGSLSIADNITGSVALGHNATGALVIGSTKNQALSKIVSPSGEARFNEIVELVNHEKENETLKEHIVLWSEYNQTDKTWNNESWEKELMASTPLTFTSDNNSDEFGFSFNNDLPNLGMPLGDWIIELFFQTATADNFNLFWLRHDTTLGQIKQHGTALTSSDWVSGSGHLLKDFDLQNPMKIRIEINNQGKDKRVKINAVRYCSYGASSYNRRWYEFKSSGTVRLKGADDDNFTINFELRKTTGSGATTLRTGSTIKIYRKGTK